MPVTRARLKAVTRQPSPTASLKTNPPYDLKGHIGQFDYNCNQSGACRSIFDWLSTYFDSTSGFADFTQNWWGWIYHGGNDGTWVNAINGSSGDITN